MGAPQRVLNPGDGILILGGKILVDQSFNFVFGGEISIGFSDTMVIHGTTIPSQFAMNASNTSLISEMDTAAAGLNSILYQARSRGSAGSRTVVASGDVLGEIDWLGHDGIDLEVAAQIRSQVDGTPGSDDMPGAIYIATTPSGGFVPVDRIKIGQDGTTEVYYPQINTDDVTFKTPGGSKTTGTVAVTTNSNAFTISGTTFSADDVGKEITITDSRTGWRGYIATVAGDGASGTFNRKWRGTPNGSKTYTLHEAKWQFETDASPGAVATNADICNLSRMRAGSRSVLGGSSGLSTQHIAEDIVPDGAAGVIECCLEFDARMRSGGGFGQTAAMWGRYRTTNEVMGAIFGAPFVASCDIQATTLGVGIAGGFLSVSNSVTNGGLVDIYGHFYGQDVTSTASTINTLVGLYLEQQTGGSANWQGFSEGGHWAMGPDNSKTYYGSAQDAAFYYDGTDLVCNPKEVGSGGFNVLGNLQCDGITNDTGLAHGTWTPTATNVANLDSSTAELCHYTRIGNQVLFWGTITVDPTAGLTPTTVSLSLPIASNFALDTDASGGVGVAGANGNGVIAPDTTNDRLDLIFLSVSTSSYRIRFIGSYEVK